MVWYSTHDVLITEKSNGNNRTGFRDSGEENKEDEISSEGDGKLIGR